MLIYKQNIQSIMSTEIVNVKNEMYDMTSDIFQDVSTESFEYLEFYDVNLNDVNSNDNFLIEMKDKENFYLLHNAYLVVNFGITDNANAAYAAGASVSLQNNAVGLFKKWMLEFDDDIVEIVDDAHICNTVQNLVDRKSTRLNSSHLDLSRMPSSA